METALFYTFSTIAQTLAASIAFLGAFALYRLQALDAVLAYTLSHVVRPWEVSSETESLVGQRSYGALADHIRALNKPDPLSPQFSAHQIEQRRRFFSAIDVERALKAAFKRVLSLTAMIISLSVGALVSTPFIGSHHGFSLIVLIAGLFGLGSCLHLHVGFVRVALEN